jgi:transcriptional activator SPT8
MPHASKSTTRSRQSSRSPGPATTHHMAPQSSSAAYQRRMNILPPPPVYDPLHPPTRQTLSLDPTIVIPHPCATYALAATPCLSYLLTGNQDGYIRSWDFWASANSGSALSALQRGVANLGEGVNKAGVAKGYWRNDVEVEEVVGGDAKNGSIKDKKPPTGAGDAAFSFLESEQANAAPAERKKVKRLEPVYSLAMQADGLWTLAGTEVSRFSILVDRILMFVMAERPYQSFYTTTRTRNTSACSARAGRSHQSSLGTCPQL